MKWFSKPWLAVLGFLVGLVIAAGGPSNLASTLTSAVGGVTGTTPPTSTPVPPTPGYSTHHGSTGNNGSGPGTTNGGATGNGGPTGGPTGGGATGGGTPEPPTGSTGGTTTPPPVTTPKPTTAPTPVPTPQASTSDCGSLFNDNFESEAVGSTVFGDGVVTSEPGNKYMHLPATSYSAHVSGNWNVKCVAVMVRAGYGAAVGIRDGAIGYTCKLGQSEMALTADTATGPTVLASHAATTNLTTWTPLYLLVQGGNAICATTSHQKLAATAPFTIHANTVVLFGANDDFDNLYISGTAG